MSTDTTWRMFAECKGDSAAYFFAPAHFERKPEKDAREGAAIAICSACRVREQCLDYALTVGEPHGIWGGVNELGRSRLQRKRSAQAS
jgi:WhiB family transcriptional regulator, redox-sensing transcriptional regulator